MDPGGALAWALLLFVCLDSASAEICSGERTLTATKMKQYVTTPNYDQNQNYPPSMDCTFIIKAPDKHRVLIEIEDLQTEPNIFSNCRDYVAFFEGDSSRNEELIGIYCASLSHRQIVSQNNFLTILLKSDDTYEYRGAKLSYQLIEPDSCPEGWNTTNFGSCIQYVWEEDQDWISAQKICNERKGNLLMIETEEEFSLFRKWFENVKQEIWIGYTDAKVEDNFTGVDETANSLQPFAANKKMMMPNNDQSDCVTVKYTEPTPFAVEPCNLKLPFICEMKRDWTTTIYPPNEETIEEGYNSSSSQFTLWLLLFLILLLMITITAFLCFVCWKQREGARVHAAESALPPPRDSEVLPISHRSEIVQHLPSTNVVAPAPAPVPVPPKLPETINLPPKPLSEFRTIENHLTSPRRVTTRPTSENRISEEVDLPSDDSNEKTAPETVQKTLDEELPRGDADYQKLVSRPHPAPRSLPPLPIRESTFHSLNTRDESFLKTRRTQELFERPRMDVLDNVSAISLDEFWSNAKS